MNVIWVDEFSSTGGGGMVTFFPFFPFSIPFGKSLCAISGKDFWKAGESEVVFLGRVDDGDGVYGLVEAT